MKANKETIYIPVVQNAFLPDILKNYDKEYFSHFYCFIKSQIKWDTTGEGFRSVFLTDIAYRLNMLTTRQLHDLIILMQNYLHQD
jgi:hypothetical protein